MQKDVTISWGTFDHGRKSAIDATAAQLTATSVKCERGVTIKASSSNTASVFIGNSDVTAETADATCGYELAAGGSVIIEVNNVNKLYAIASVGHQTVYWVSV